MHYSTALFNSLPSLESAEEQFNSKDAKQYLEGPIRQVFLDFDVQNKYGLALLHNHFPMKENQRLVDYHSTATAWQVADDVSPVSPKYNGYVVPRGYMFNKDDVIPYEFTFVPGSDLGAEVDSVTSYFSFFNALNKTLTALGLEKLFGIRDLQDYDSEKTVEITEGEANIMLPSSSETFTDATLLEALWIFGPKTTPCYCARYCFRPYCGCGHHVNHY